VHPAVTAENIEKPSLETASNMYQHVAEFAYDMDIQKVKERAPEIPMVGQYIEIFDEAMDVIATFKLARQLAFINRVEDFSMKDIWDPQPKRARAVLSGMINFCRYKESQTAVISSMKQEVSALDNIRLELVDKSNAVGHELAEAQALHSAELQEMWQAENEMQEATSTVDKLQKQKNTADKIHESADTKLQAAKEKLAENEKRAEQLRDNIASLQEQVAESPEGLEQEVQELQLAIRQQKARVEEKSDEKRARAQRVQVLGRLKSNTDAYKEALDKVSHAADVQAAACDRTRGARNELAVLRSTLEARRVEELELGQQVEQVNLDRESAEQTHAEHVEECEERRKQALVKQEEIQGKRTEEQKQWSVLQAQRAELEGEMAAVRRAHEAEMSDYQTNLRAMQDDGEAYVQTVEGLVSQCNAEAGRSFPVGGSRPTGYMSASPGSASRGKRRSSLEMGSGTKTGTPGRKASPAPRRLVMGSAGY